MELLSLEEFLSLNNPGEQGKGNRKKAKDLGCWSPEPGQ